MNATFQQSTHPSPIGGYFELELPKAGGALYPGAIKFQSARAALISLLLQFKPRRIWMPWYNCGTLSEAAKSTGVEVARYFIDTDLYPMRLDGFGASDWLLYVNYFGVCGDQVVRLLNKLPLDQIIIDHSQAFYAAPLECLATLYSPRKFFGVPDGGYLVTQLGITQPEVRDERSMERMTPLLTRLAEGPEAGYAEAKIAQASFRGQPPRAMSALTEAMLTRIDYRGALVRRNANFTLIDRRLRSVNRFPFSKAPIVGPLCYPLLADVDGLHEWLIDHRVFVARYWPDVLSADALEDDFESILVRRCVPLPCDQRYDASDMNRVVDLVLAFLDSRRQ